MDWTVFPRPICYRTTYKDFQEEYDGLHRLPQTHLLSNHLQRLPGGIRWTAPSSPDPSAIEPLTKTSREYDGLHRLPQTHLLSNHLQRLPENTMDCTVFPRPICYRTTYKDFQEEYDGLDRLPQTHLLSNHLQRLPGGIQWTAPSSPDPSHQLGYSSAECTS